MQDPGCSMVCSQQGLLLFLVTNQFTQNFHLPPPNQKCAQDNATTFFGWIYVIWEAEFFLGGGE